MNACSAWPSYAGAVGAVKVPAGSRPDDPPGDAGAPADSAPVGAAGGTADRAEPRGARAAAGRPGIAAEPGPGPSEAAVRGGAVGGPAACSGWPPGSWARP